MQLSVTARNLSSAISENFMMASLLPRELQIAPLSLHKSARNLIFTTAQSSFANLIQV